MNDHVARMVNGWFNRAKEASQDPEADLVNAIHRMIREAEDEMRRRCEEIALRMAGPEVGGRIALAIRMSADSESLPRRTLTDVYADS